MPALGTKIINMRDHSSTPEFKPPGDATLLVQKTEKVSPIPTPGLKRKVSGSSSSSDTTLRNTSSPLLQRIRCKISPIQDFMRKTSDSSTTHTAGSNFTALNISNPALQPTERKPSPLPIPGFVRKNTTLRNTSNSSSFDPNNNNKDNSSSAKASIKKVITKICTSLNLKAHRIAHTARKQQKSDSEHFSGAMEEEMRRLRDEFAENEGREERARLECCWLKNGARGLCGGVTDRTEDLLREEDDLI